MNKAMYWEVSVNSWRVQCNRAIRYALAMVIIGYVSSLTTQAQENIPLGAWRLHISFNRVHTIAYNPDFIFAGTENGIMALDRQEGAVTVYSKLNGLSSSGVTFINFDDATSQLLIGYEDGDLDILKNGTLTNFKGLKNIAISGSRAIRHISFNNGFAYLSMEYGVVVFDLNRQNVKETWRDIGETGNSLKINQSTILGDSIFLATGEGILGGDLNDNLLDYNNWKRFTQGDLNADVPVITSFNNKVICGVDYSGIHTYTDGVWALESYLQGQTFTFLSGDVDLMVTSSAGVARISSTNILTNITDPLIASPLVALQTGMFQWIGDGKNGLVGNPNGGYEKFLGNGPSNQRAFRLKFDGTTMHAVSGGYSNGFLPLNNEGREDLFTKGLWNTETLTIPDLTDRAFSGPRSYTSSFGYGLLQEEGATSVLYDNTNSPLENISPGKNVYVTAIKNSSDGLWVANYSATNPYHLLKSDNTWESYSFNGGVSRYPTSINVDVNASVWAPQNQGSGGGIFVFNKRDNKQTYLTDAPNVGGLPNRNVNAVAMDRDGAVWVGTEKGVAYFVNPYSIFSTGVNAIRPIFENRYLLQDEKITAIKVDGGNRKWIGTERGVWLFNPTGEELLYNFTEDNSPLLSDKIIAIEIDGITGEVFFATDKGIASFRSDATSGNLTFNTVKIFPNPVTPEFNGDVGISGLVTDATVKITDVSGKLVWETKAEGGTAVWGVRDFSGKHVATGIYLVFASTNDGTERMVGKLAVIE